MLTQPQPDACPPPASEPALRSQRLWRGLLVVGILSIFALIAIASIPRFVCSHRKPANQTQAVNNARQIGLALFEFETEYGHFPDSSTIAAVNSASKHAFTLHTKTSNDFFRQLLATGLAYSEQMFYAKINGAHRPDDDFSGKKALEKGEVGFSYFAGLSLEGNPSRPLVVTPLIPGTTRFDWTKFDGKAVFLRIDNSVTSVNINKDVHVMVDGKNILDPDHPIWGGEKWTLVSPE